VLQRSKLSRVEILEKVLDNPCNEHCNGQWLRCAKQLLTWNDISTDVFTKAVRNILAIIDPFCSVTLNPYVQSWTKWMKN